MQLPNDFNAFSNVITKIPQAQVARAISLIALVYIAYVLAQMTWQIVAKPLAYQPLSSHSKTATNTASEVNINQLTALNVFGKEEPKAPVVEESYEDVPETKLQLTLSGVVASSNPDTAAAIIEHNGKQETYGIGDKISGTRASLDKVHADRVIIKQSGRKETLMLDGFDYNNKLASAPSKRSVKRKPVRQGPSQPLKNNNIVDLRNNKALTSRTKALREALSNDPGKLTDYLNISPARVNSQLIGFKLRPGKDREFFKASGLKPGDVAVQMNGLDLTDGTQVQDALKLLKTEKEISLLVKRNEELTEILFSIENE